MLHLNLELGPGLSLRVEGEPPECARLILELQQLMAPGAPTPDGGLPNRREQVLKAMHVLRSSGQTAPDLDAIREMVTRLFPRAETRNLDQVVRDLANKVGKLSRMEWGRYRLVEEPES